MIRLDSLDVTLDTGDLPKINEDRLRLSETTDQATGEVRSSFTIKAAETGLHGFNGLLATETSVSFRLSAKAMGNRYTDGISTETLPELCDRITSTGIVTVTPDQLRSRSVRRADPFVDAPTADLVGFTEAIRLLGNTTGDSAQIKGRGDGLTLYHKLPGGLGMLRSYAKGPEMSKAAQREFCTLYPAAARGLVGYQRSELAAQTYTASRAVAAMAKGVPTLGDVLDSTRTPVSDALDSLLSTWAGLRRAVHALPTLPSTLDVMLSAPTATPSADGLRLLATLIVDLVGGDYTAAQAAVRARYGVKHASRLYPLLRAACEAYGQAVEAEPTSDAHDTLTTYAARVRERETATDLAVALTLARF